MTWLFPRDQERVIDRLLFTRSLRGFIDGAVTVLLADYLTHFGFSAFQISAIVTGTLVGSALLTLFVGLRFGTANARTVLLWACALMFVTGLGLASFSTFWPLFLVAFVGTMNPSAGDVSVFLPVEQAMLAGRAPVERRTRLFAWYNLCGALAGAVGALCSGVPVWLARSGGVSLLDAERGAFVAYALIGLACAAVYRTLPTAAVQSTSGRHPLERSRGVVYRMAALFSLDSAGGGFVLQSLLVLWLFRRFSLSVEEAGAIFFAGGVLAAFSQLASSWLAERIGMVETMVFTHLPANAFLILAGLMPSAPLAITFLLLRMGLSNMDVPARQAYVMSVVPPEERAAASSVTNVPRSLATAATPLLAGLMLEKSDFGWPLIVGGALKTLYDVLFLWQFRDRRPIEGVAP